MHGLIACDSYFGNTLQVADAVAEELRAAGHAVTVVNLHEQKFDVRKPPAADAGFLGIGGPTRMARMSRGDAARIPMPRQQHMPHSFRLRLPT